MLKAIYNPHKLANTGFMIFGNLCSIDTDNSKVTKKDSSPKAKTVVKVEDNDKGKFLYRY